MRMRPMLLGAGLLLAAWLTLSGKGTPAAPIAPPLAGTSASPRFQAARAAPVPVILALQRRDAMIDQAGPARDGLFDSQTWVPPAPPPPKPLPPAPPPPPMAPPLPYVYIGKKLENGIWEAYLARGNQTFIVREQTVIEGSYRADSVKPPNLTLTYLPLNQVQTITIGGTE